MTYSPSVSGSRTQYPIRLAYASTIHKSQGQTMEKTVIDLGDTEKSLGLTFVENYKKTYFSRNQINLWLLAYKALPLYLNNDDKRYFLY
jgi:hypothetical protein